MAARSFLPEPNKSADGASGVPPTPDNIESRDIRSRTTGTTIEVIRKRSDFLAANRGKRFVAPGFVLLCHPRPESHPVHPDLKRFGITVTKKIGNAVTRNRMKRCFRALMAETLPEHGLAGADHIMIGRKQAGEPQFADMKSDLVKGLAHLARKVGK
ncbi:ribonuclease P protein component [Parasphingorhabdus marina]|uniref:ribonuclease P protein component n=1 Tax=Parasphingorhabdus marina TaxID=394732 RepID=UPI00194ED92E|nr:ribonuclease P protein component [Parasphingorhabdus marina]